MENTRDNLAVDIGESELTPLISVCQAGVINAEQLHDCGLHVVNVNWVSRNIPGILICGTVDVSTFYSSTC